MDKLAEWEAEYNRVMNAGREDLHQDWGINANMSGIDKGFGLGSLRYDDEGIPDLPKYEFGRPFVRTVRVCLRLQQIRITNTSTNQIRLFRKQRRC